MLLDPLQRTLAQAVVVPQPRATGGEQHQHEDISEGQHQQVAPTRWCQLNCVAGLSYRLRFVAYCAAGISLV
ncbi:hypothetical protein D3C84_1248290 [compost metagenome]